MNMQPDDIRFDCPQCHRSMTGDIQLLSGLVDCPDCGQNFKPVRKPRISPVRPALNRVEKLRRLGDGFTAAALVAFGLGLLILLLAVLLGVMNSGKYVAALIVAAAFLSNAVWLFLIAQIIHIRANTEK